MPNLALRSAVSWILLISLIVAALLGGLIKPHAIDRAHELLILKDTTTDHWLTAPYKPGSMFRFGSDHRGFDILSLILNGMKYTLGIAFLITALRFAAALPIGMISGSSGRGRSLIAALQWMFTSVPALIVLLPTLKMTYYMLRLDMGVPEWHINQIVFSLIVIASIGFIGVFPLAHQIGERASFYERKLFVTASYLLGGSPLHRIRKHLLPNMRAELLYMFMSEFVQVMFLMGQLALLGVFIGGGENFTISEGYMISLTTTGEWCALIAYGVLYIRIYPWIAVSVCSFYAVSIWIIQYFLKQQKHKLRSTAFPVKRARVPMPWKWNKGLSGTLGSK